jgi:hypothetical protein
MQEGGLTAKYSAASDLGQEMEHSIKKTLLAFQTT